MKKIYSAVFGSGLGHAARVHAVASRLRTDTEVEFLYSSFEEGYDYLQSYGEKVLLAPSLQINWNVTGGVSGSDTLIHFPRAIANFSRQVEFEDKHMKEYAPRLMLSDSRLSAVFAAKRNSFPAVTILNQAKILFPPRFRRHSSSRIFERLEAEILGAMWSLSDEILFPDLPPPYTISESNLSHVDSVKKARYTGFMIPERVITGNRLTRLKSSLGMDSRPVVFMQISGPSNSKRSFLDPAIQCAARMSRRCNVVVSAGQPSGSYDPRKIGNGGWLYEWCPVKDELFALSDVLVTRSGHTTLGQSIDSGKPCVLVPIFNHSEQIWNAKKFASLGLGIEIRSENLNSMNLEEAIVECIENPLYRTNSERMSRVSKKYAGVANAKMIIDRFF